MKLINRRDHSVIADHVVVADTLWTRTRGLLGKTELPETEALWIKRCNSIHTFFMHFPIDVLFVDKSGVVRKSYENVAPYRLILPVWKASDTIELKAGVIQKLGIQKGDAVHVGT